MATIDGGGNGKKTGSHSPTKPNQAKQDTNEVTNTSGAKSQKDFSDMTAEEIVAIVVNTAVVAKRQMSQMVVANYSGNTPGIVVQIPGWHVVNGEVRAVQP